MGKVTIVDNRPKVQRAMLAAQRELLQEMRDFAEAEMQARYKAWATDPDFRVRVVGDTTISMEMGSPGIFLEKGTGTRHEDGGKPYDIPKPKSWEWSAGPGSKPKFDYSLREETAYRIEYRYFRTKDGKVKSIPKKVPIKVEKGRRLKADGTPKKALFIPGVGFRHAVYDHPGISPRPIIRPAAAEVRDRWDKVATSKFANVMRRFGVAKRG